MKEIGLQPAGTDPGYIQEVPCPRFHLTETRVGDSRSRASHNLYSIAAILPNASYANLTTGELTGPQRDWHAPRPISPAPILTVCATGTDDQIVDSKHKKTSTPSGGRHVGGHG
jgi:hypothetical protein